MSNDIAMLTKNTQL